MKIKSKHTGINSHNKSLSVQFSLDGFSFCIRDIDSKEIVLFNNYEFDRTLATPELLLEKVSAIFSENKALQHDFNKIEVIHQNSLSTLVPDTYFDQKELKSYLDYNVKTLNNDYITFDDVNTINAKNIYIPFVNINNYLFQNFGSFNFKHHSTLLIEKLIAHSKNETERVFFVQVFKHTLNIVVTQNNNLILYNSFEYSSKEDFLYYILFVAEQLEMNPNEFQLIFLGIIDKESPNYKITHKYVRNIDFIKTKTNFFNTDDEFLNHSNYILIS